MPLLSFRKPFGELIVAGKKRQTVRARRKDLRDPAVGDRLFLYTGLRTQHAKKLGEATCTRVDRIHIEEGARILINGCVLSMREALDFAKADGFANPLELATVFEEMHGLPFDGLVFHWGKLEGGA